MILLLIILWRILYQVLVALETPHDALSAFQVLGGIIYLAAFIWLAFRSQVAARQWFTGLGTVSRWAGLVGRHWIGVVAAVLHRARRDADLRRHLGAAAACRRPCCSR